MQTKKCTKCGQEKPLDEFYTKGNGKLHSWCKKCFNQHQVEQRKQSEDRKAYKRQWNKENKESRQEYNKRKWAEYREQNPKRPSLTDEEKETRRKEAVRRYQEKRRRQAREERAGREKRDGRACARCNESKPLSEYKTRWGRVCKFCKGQQHIAYEQRRMEKDLEFRETKRIYKEKDRARRLDIEGSHTAKEWMALKDKYGHKCAHCGEVGRLTKDHIIPVSKGGTDNIDNIQPLCRKCNSRKSNK